MGLEEVYLRNLEHKGHRSGWLRAAVLGVNDGLVSTASLMIGVAVASASLDNARSILMSTGAAGIAAGALSMAVGEYISVSSQTDIEESDRLLEIEHLAIDPEGELEELTQIYQARGLSRQTASQVAKELHEHDALAAHLRDELGQHDATKARPLQAAFASALSFTAGGAIPLIGALAPSLGSKAFSIVGITLLGLMIAGVISARTAGSSVARTTGRILFGGVLGMAITAGIGQLFHASVA